MHHGKSGKCSKKEWYLIGQQDEITNFYVVPQARQEDFLFMGFCRNIYFGHNVRKKEIPFFGHCV
jgi:hypothetical protein